MQGYIQGFSSGGTKKACRRYWFFLQKSGEAVGGGGHLKTQSPLKYTPDHGAIKKFLVFRVQISIEGQSGGYQIGETLRYVGGDCIFGRSKIKKLGYSACNY